MPPLLEINAVTHFYGRLAALHEVTLALEPGPIGLVGQNGAGKSTLLKILLGMLSPTHGRAEVLGHNVRTGGVQLRGRVGYMPERDAHIPGLNGIEYVALAGELCGMPRKQALRRAHEMLSYLGMEDARYRKVDGYSVGMRQRLKLAATLVHDPDLLLLDEPTAGLDPEGRTAMLTLLKSLAQRSGKSLILSTHLLGDIERVCRTAVILDAGRVLHVGPISGLRIGRPSCFRLRVRGSIDAFAAKLREAGVQVQSDSRADEVLATVPENWNSRDFFVQAGHADVALTGLEPEEESLESAYQRLVVGNVSNAPSAETT